MTVGENVAGDGEAARARYGSTDVGGDGGDPLDRFWTLYDVPDPLLPGYEALWWPAGSLDRLVGLGLLKEDAPAGQAACPSCPDRHVEEVVAAPGPDGAIRHFVRCPDAGRVEVPGEWLRQWRPDFQELARRVKELLGIGGRATPRMPDRLWRLGDVAWPGRPREAYLARGLAWPDGPSVAAEVPGDARPILFVGLHGPPPTAWASPVPPAAVVPLAAVLRTGGDGRLELKHTLLASFVSGADRTADAAGAAADEEQRRRFRRYAREQAASEGVEALVRMFAAEGWSNRRIAAALKERGFKRNQATIARMKTRLGLTTRLAGSSKSVVRGAGSQPRDRSGRPIASAEPDQNP